MKKILKPFKRWSNRSSSRTSIPSLKLTKFEASAADTPMTVYRIYEQE